MEVLCYEEIDGKQCPRVTYLDMIKNFINSEVVYVTNIVQASNEHSMVILNTCSYKDCNKMSDYYAERNINAVLYKVDKLYWRLILKTENYL